MADAESTTGSATGSEERPTLEPGSDRDFDVLYRRSYGRILATLTGVLNDRAAAEDCTQETFVRAYRAWSRWRPDAKPETWLHRIAINVAHSYRRRAQMQEVGEVIRRLGRPADAEDPQDLAEQNTVLAALARLPQKQAAVLVLRHYHGYSNREIGLSLGVPERTVASRLAKAKERLRAIVGEDPAAADAPAGEPSMGTSPGPRVEGL